MPAKAKICRVCGAQYGRGEAFCPVDGGRLSSASEMERTRTNDPIVGSVFDGRYHILRMVGEGGMGIVYEAEHVKLDKRVAIKVLREDFTRRPDVVARFRQEARSASRIGHPNIIDVSDFGETPGGASYIVMEMLQGEDLADLLAREYVLSPLRATGIVYQCCKALSAVHRLGIVHRDLKPENLFIVRREEQADFVKIVDFGVAKMTDIELGGAARKLTTTGMIFGTPEYMSPEQSRGESLDHRVDIYAMGVILYELVTGRVPFEGENFMEILNRHGREPVPPLRQKNPATHVSAELEAVILRALNKDPQARFQDGDAMADAISLCPEMPTRVASGSLLPPDWSISAPPPPPSGHHALAQTVALEDDDEMAAEPLRVPFLARPVGRAFMLASAMGFGVVAAVVAPSLWDTPPNPAAATTAGPDAERASLVSVAAAAPAPAPQAAAGPVEPGPTPEATPIPAAQLVEVDIVTRPPGARVELAGQGEVCARTPCTVALPRGLTARLLATHGELHASAGVTPERGTEVRMSLRGPVRTARPAKPVRRDDLKVPEMFR